MRIGISTGMIQRGRSGVAKHVFSLLRALLPYCGEHCFHLFVLEEDRPLFEFAREQMQIIPVSERFRSPLRNILWHQTALPRRARRHQLDLLHVPSYRRLLFAKPCPLVATIHDLAPFHLQGKYDPLRMFYGKVVVKRLAQRQDRIIAVSENTARDIKRFFNRSANLSVIYNGIDHTRFFPPNGPEPGPPAPCQLRKPFMLYVARLEHPGKNHLRLIDAFALFKKKTGSNWQLALAGSDWHGAEVIHEAAAHSPVAQDIVPLGFVPDEELPALYQSASLFIFPSLHEGFGLPPIEAMACGCPVISSSRGALGEVVGEAALIVNPENPEEMAEKMAEAASNEALRERLRLAGLQRAEWFDWDKAAAQTMEVYALARGTPQNRTDQKNIAGLPFSSG